MEAELMDELQFVLEASWLQLPLVITTIEVH